MKKICFLLFSWFFISTINGQCSIDSNALSREGIYPKYDSLPCIVRSNFYDETIQVQCPTYFDSVINFGITSYPVAVSVDSMELDSIIGLPVGISWAKNPNRLVGGQKGCLTFEGTTSDAVGTYKLLWHGTIWATLPSPIPAPYNKQTYYGFLNKMPWFDYYLGVVNSGDACKITISTDVREWNDDLNSSLQVYPNPNNGAFELKLNPGFNIQGELAILDIAGRIVYHNHILAIGSYSQSFDANSFNKGIYFIQLKTVNGTAIKKMTIE